MFKHPQRSYCIFWMFAVLPDHFLFVSRVTGAEALIPQGEQCAVLGKISEHFWGAGGESLCSWHKNENFLNE